MTPEGDEAQDADQLDAGPETIEDLDVDAAEIKGGGFIKDNPG